MSGGGGGEELPSREAAELKGHEGAVLVTRFNSNGDYCLSCEKDRTIRLLNPHRKTYKSHGHEFRDVHVTSFVFIYLLYTFPFVYLCVCVLILSLGSLCVCRENSKLSSCGGEDKFSIGIRQLEVLSESFAVTIVRLMPHSSL